MKVLVMSDTHGHLKRLKMHLQTTIYDAYIHLGDHADDLARLDLPSDARAYVVSGNCDHGGIIEQLVDLSGHQIFITHGHRYGVKGTLETLARKARSLGVRIALFGHTHMAHESHWEDVLLLNPGSAGLPKGGDAASVMVLDCSEEGIKPHWVLLE